MKNFLVIIVGMVLVIGFSSCSRSLYVPLESSSYQSKLSSEDFPNYKGKDVYLGQFTNNAENTSIFYFYNQDYSIYYGGPVLTSFLWYCFNSALLGVGIGVHEHSAPKDTPEMDFSFRSFDENSIDFTVVLRRNSFQIFKKSYQLSVPSHQSKDPKYLEQRAYSFIDQIVSKILGDKEFESAFLKG